MNVCQMTFLAAILAVGLGITPAMSQEAKRLGAFGAWVAYSYTEAGGKVCYAAARADKTQGGDKGRQGTVVAVTHRAKSAGEVSLNGAYGFKKDAEAEILLSGNKHTFFAQGQSAWAKEASADKPIVAAMIRGREVIVRATPAKGAAIVDTVSLTGFSDALAAIDKACGVKR